MIEFFSAANSPFAVALILVGAIGVIELATLTTGGSISGFLDGLLPDVNLDVDIDAPGHLGGVSHLYSWFSIGKLPALVLFVLFLTFFGMFGWTIQSIWSSLTGTAMNNWIASAISIPLGLIGMGRLGNLISRVMPKEQGLAPSKKQFIGSSVNLTLKDADPGVAVEGVVKDLSGKEHYIMVEVESGAEPIKKGDHAIVIKPLESGAYRIASGVIKTK